MDRRLSALISPFSDITEDRKVGIEIATRLEKKGHLSTKEDVKWFWKDIDWDCDKEVAWDYVNERLERLNQMYPFELTEWLMNWYRFMPDALSLHKNGAGTIDWNIWFTLIYPLPKGLFLPFHIMIKTLNTAQNRIVRKQVYQKCFEDEKLRTRLLNYLPIPAIYTHYAKYGKIRSEVMKLMNPAKVKPDIEAFKAADRLMRETGCSIKEAFTKVRETEVIQ